MAFAAKKKARYKNRRSKIGCIILRQTIRVTPQLEDRMQAQLAGIKNPILFREHLLSVASLLHVLAYTCENPASRSLSSRRSLANRFASFYRK